MKSAYILYVYFYFILINGKIFNFTEYNELFIKPLIVKQTLVKRILISINVN